MRIEVTYHRAIGPVPWLRARRGGVACLR